MFRRLVVRSSACPPRGGEGVLWEKVWGCAIASYIEKNMSVCARETSSV
jgi:hypothetical protein